MTEMIDGKPGQRRRDQRGHRNADAVEPEIAGTVMPCPRRANQMLGRHGEKYIQRTDQRHRHVEHAKTRPDKRQQQAAAQSGAANHHQHPRTETVGQTPDMNSNKKGKHRIQRKQHADLKRRRAKLDGVEGHQHLAALVRNVIEHRQCNDKIEIHGWRCAIWLGCGLCMLPIVNHPLSAAVAAVAKTAPGVHCDACNTTNIFRGDTACKSKQSAS